MRSAFLMLCFLVGLTACGQPQADEIIVEKSRRSMTLYHQGAPMKRYHVALGKNPVGPKRQEGDFKTPEGVYVISGRKEDSYFHLALAISYPSAADKEAAYVLGLEPGGNIMIHGRPHDFAIHPRPWDWTHGCIAVTNREIEEIWRLVPDGTPIEIRP